MKWKSLDELVRVQRFIPRYMLKWGFPWNVKVLSAGINKEEVITIIIVSRAQMAYPEHKSGLETFYSTTGHCLASSNLPSDSNQKDILHAYLENIYKICYVPSIDSNLAVDIRLISCACFLLCADTDWISLHSNLRTWSATLTMLNML